MPTAHLVCTAPDLSDLLVVLAPQGAIVLTPRQALDLVEERLPDEAQAARTDAAALRRAAALALDGREGAPEDLSKRTRFATQSSEWAWRLVREGGGGIPPRCMPGHLRDYLDLPPTELEQAAEDAHEAWRRAVALGPASEADRLRAAWRAALAAAAEESWAVQPPTGAARCPGCFSCELVDRHGSRTSPSMSPRIHSAPLLYAVLDDGTCQITGPLASTWCRADEDAIDAAERRLLAAHREQVADVQLDRRGGVLLSLEGFPPLTGP